MFEEKIIQIIPALQLVGVYAEEDGKLTRNPIDYLALIEDKDGYTHIEPGEIGPDGVSYEDLSTAQNFIGVEHGGKEEDWTEQVKEYLTLKSMDKTKIVKK